MGWLESLQNSSIAWFILSAFSIFGVLFAVITWIKGKHKREFTYAKTTYQLVIKGVSTIDRLKLLYDDAPISDLSVTRITVWNSGTGEIRREDLYSGQLLCIKSTENARILDASIIQQCDGEKFTASMNESGDVTFDFECAEKRDGFVIQILHSGDADELKPPEAIKGGKIRAYQADSKITVAAGVAGVAAAVAVAVGGVAAGALAAGALAAGAVIAAGVNLDVILNICLILLLISRVLLHISDYNLSIPSKLRKYVKVEIHS